MLSVCMTGHSFPIGHHGPCTRIYDVSGGAKYHWTNIFRDKLYQPEAEV